MLLFDYHSHHYRCGHAVGSLTDYCDAAEALGLTTFGVSDHGPAYWLPGNHAQPQTQMAYTEVAAYVDEAHALKAAYSGRLDVRVGLEADWIPGHEEPLAALLGQHAFDYVLGSVHYILGQSIFARGRWRTENANDVYRAYYLEVCRAAKSGLFDIMSHLSAIEAYGPEIDSVLSNDLYQMVAEAVAEGGCIVEINTSGYRKMPQTNEPFPNRKLIKALLACRVPLTFSSDCHRPDEVGFGYERVLTMLQELGSVSTGYATTVQRGPIETISVAC